MHKEKKQIMLRSGISYILAFLLTICVTLMTVLVVVRFGCFSRDSLSRNMSSYGYYDYVYADLMDDAEAITLPTGLPSSVYEDAITQTDIYSDINGKLDAQFSGQTYTSKASEIRQRLRGNINAYLESREYTLLDEDQSSVEAYVSEIVNDYEKYISMPLGTYLVRAKGLFDKVFLIAEVALLVVSVIIIFVILQLHRWLHRALRYFSYTALGCALLLLAVPGYFYIQKLHYRLALNPESFYHLATTYIDDILKLFLYFGGLWIVIAIVCVIATAVSRKHIKRGNK